MKGLVGRDLRKRLGKVEPGQAGAFREPFGKPKPDATMLKEAVAELGEGVKAHDPAAFRELEKILTGDPCYPDRESLIAEMIEDSNLNGITALFIKRKETAESMARSSGVPVDEIELFDGVVRPLLLLSSQPDISELSDAEAEFMEAYLADPKFPIAKDKTYVGYSVDVDHVRTHYLKLQRELTVFISVAGDTSSLSGDFQKFVRDRTISLPKSIGDTSALSDDLFDVFHQLAVAYANMDPDEIHYCPGFLLSHLQLEVLISEPLVVSDPRFDRVLEFLAGVDCNLPLELEMYTDYESIGRCGGRYVLKESVTEGFIATAERLTSNPILWNGESFERQLFASIAQAVGLLSREYPEETREIRLRLLEKFVFSKRSSESRFHLVQTFETDEDRKAVEAIRDDGTKPPKLREEAKKILDGGYDMILS